jgi:replicative DNA helicase
MPRSSATSVVQDKSFDIDSEVSILGYAVKCGSQNFYSGISDIDSSFFKDKDHGLIFESIKNSYESRHSEEPSIEAVANFARNSASWTTHDKETFLEKLEACYSKNVSEADANLALRRVKYWHIVRKLGSKLKESYSDLCKTSGDEDIVEIVTKVEETIFSFIPEIKKENDYVNICDFALGHIEYIKNNPVSYAGMPTGFPRYDQCIGGGYRRGTVNVVGARPKVGKSTFCLNVAKNVASNGVPVLYLDTEMKKETQTVKWVSLCSGIPQSEIETGAFASSERSSFIIKETIENLKSTPFYHTSVAGLKPQEIFSVCRRWLASVVGKNKDGSTKDCLIILDYLKTMDLGDLGDFQEYQYLGDFITKLHNFAVKSDVPVLATVQLNRDGINKEDTSVVSGSDRILWLCSSLAYLKKKTDEDIAAGDSKANGDRKMVVVETRYGKGMDSSSEYINVVSNMDKSQFTEGKFNFEVIGEGLENDDDDEDLQF